ncbi:MAG TPA: ABC transporter permease [Actinomycetota bacterium]|nr:ABC transporter permease [Actinomycetota bacterium]
MSDALRSFRLMFRWQYFVMRQELWLLTVIQAVLALGIVYGLAFLIPDIDGRTAAYLATGAPTITLLIAGLQSAPSEISRDKLSGRHAYVAALPVPRLALPAARLAFSLFLQLPGTTLAIVVAALRFDFALDVSFMVVPALLLVATSSAAVGYGMGEVMRPEVAMQTGSFLSILILLFSPLNFPMERLPEALQTVHLVLPIKYMGDLVRWSLTGQFVENVALAFGIVTLWCALGVAACWRAALRRP